MTGRHITSPLWLFAAVVVASCGPKPGATPSAPEAPTTVAAEAPLPAAPAAEPPEPEPPAAPAFPDRAVATLRGLADTSEAAFVEAHPDAQCTNLWGSDRVCEVGHPPAELCLGGATCSSIGYVFRGNHVVSARMTLLESAFTPLYAETADLLGEPQTTSQRRRGICSSVERATFTTAAAKIQFEYRECGATARLRRAAGDHRLPARLLGSHTPPGVDCLL